jgi:hypothetical protein
MLNKGNILFGLGANTRSKYIVLCDSFTYRVGTSVQYSNVMLDRNRDDFQRTYGIRDPFSPVAFGNLEHQQRVIVAPTL